MKLHKLILSVVMLSGIAGCNTEVPDDKIDVENTGKVKVAKKPANKFNFNAPITIDSSAYVMYPLVDKNEEKNVRDEYGSFSSGSGRGAAYWNIVFYNVISKKPHLLGGDKKMLITNYSISSSSSDVDMDNNNIVEKGKYIFYKIITSDYNKDGQLNYHDPEYLFLSDKEGYGLKQISPAGMQVINWEVINNTGKLLLQAKLDSNGDKEFDQNDEHISYVYDLATGNLETVFGAEFNAITSKLFNKHWTVKNK